ncbi:substrate-binding domain-containing protein [Marimonas arenosa]|uniref:substrate-binding domain-containing protein n=1 Tax=Marimonas arenosa TaxID=1795305 RepID=UPI0035E3E128
MCRGDQQLRRFSRRSLLGFLGAAVCARPGYSLGSDQFKLGITPVFLDNDANLLDTLGTALSEASGFTVEFEQRRTYEEVTGLLLQGAVDAAWLCGFPFLQHQDAFSLLAVPVWHGQPLYQSYLIVGASDTATTLDDLKGAAHAFSDPDSNSGYLMTVTDLVRAGETPTDFFSRSIFTYGHRNVVRAVAAGLVRSGSVDGYVWEVLATEEPDLTRRTKVIAKSEWVGFPPFCARKERMSEPRIRAFQKALLTLVEQRTGKQALDLLQLDGMALGEPDLYAGIAARMRELEALR